MTILPNYPMVAQRTYYTAYGLPSENIEMNCFPSSILSMNMYFSGIQQVDKEWDPDRILNMAYPEGYQGGTEASKFVDACKHFGVHLFAIDGDNAALVTKAHQYLAQGKPVLFTIVDPYMGYGNSLSCGLSHLGLPLSDEITIAPGGIVKQHFERGVLAYDPVPHHIDNPPGWGSVYPMHLYSGPGQDPGIAKLQAIVADLTAANNMQAQKITDLQQEQVVDPLASQALATVRQIKTMVQPF